MITTIKRTLLAGVGAAVLTQKKLSANFDQYVEQGRISAGDAQKLAEKIARQSRKELTAASITASENVRKLLERADRETALRINQLVASMDGEASAPTTTTRPAPAKRRRRASKRRVTPA